VRNWPELKEAFGAAVEAGPSGHARHVAALASIDPALAARLEAMLAADARGDVLQQLFEVEAERSQVQPPARVGAYEVIDVLGAGGMGEVYRARDTRLNRDVAIKVLPASVVGDAGRLARLEREAQLLAALNHPHIAQLYGLEESGGVPALVMELVEGPTLAQVIASSRDSPLPVSRVCAIARQVADALQAAHEKGIVHRDLKPGNVALTNKGDAKVLDFGVAKTLAGAGTHTSVGSLDADAGVVLGTPEYMSPEQVRGLPIDERTDVWAFGCLLYELLVRRQAFAGVTPSDSLAAVLERHPDMTLFPRETPAALRALVEQCLQKDATRRLPRISDARRAIDASMGPRRAGAPGFWAAPLGAVALVGLLLWVAGVRWWGSREPRPLPAVPLTSLAGGVSSPSLSPDGASVVFSWTGPEHGNRDLYVQQIGGGAPHRLTTHPGGDYNPAWSPDGRRIAFVRRELAHHHSEVRTIEVAGGAEHKLADIRPNLPFGGVISLAWCPDAACVVVSDAVGRGRSDGLFAITLATGEKRQLTYPEGLVADLDPVISPDGGSLIFRRHSAPFSGAFYRLTLGGRAPSPPTRLTDSLSSGTSAWTSDGREIVFSTGRALWRLDALKGGTPVRLPFVGEDGQGPVIVKRPDGKQRLVYVRSISDSNVWRLTLPAPGRPAASPPVRAVASTRSDFTPGLSPVGGRIAFWSNRSGEPQIWASDLDGAHARQLTSIAFRSLPAWPRWSPDARWIAFHGDPEGRPDVLMVPAEGGKAQILTATVFSAAFPSFSRDGRFLYLCRWQGPETRIWKMPVTGGPPEPVTSDPGFVPIESPDGRHLYYVSAADRPSPLWRVPVAGGAPVKLFDGVLFGNFDVADDGIYYLERVSSARQADLQPGRPGASELRLQYYDLSNGRSTTIAMDLGMAGHGLTVSRDGRHIFFSRIDSAIDELMLVDDFR
jgi:Tol biopolymer transport system component